jgi:hypothetical protein
LSFVCPKCGFKDSPCWRFSHWFLYTLTTKIDELETFEPAVARKLVEAKDSKGHSEIEIGPYTYMLSKTGRCYRLRTDLKAEYKRGHWTEKPKPFKPNPQQVLSEVASV